ncbi:MAG TPA: MATE family efflux transporter [Persephonella sp.]|uniref:Multidrug-efflux transporter n=1 Tax=Persephonella marina (strain DSM 14350 / EX-H1) TaxID=123214 RepID=C0QQI0_PERMH|nr:MULTISPECIES: MATE family efflux transporter [Persephonella]ACO03890.1 sodium-driven multidrug efflux pump protein [Persephonella marina EX-H1]HCB69443.1 MATE family efflux transporter [Persephonella sp.]
MNKKILHLAIPAALTNLLDTLQLLIDILMVGRISPEAVGAVGLSGQLIILIYSFISIFYIGTNVLVSRFYGEKKPEEAGKAVSGLLIISVLFSLPFFIYTYEFSGSYFSLMGAERSVINLGTDYTSILSLSIPFLFIGAVLYSSIVASGDTKTPLIISLFTNLLNTFLNYCLIFGNFGFPRLEVEGAAIATTISYILEVLIYFFIFLSGKTGIKPELSLSFHYVLKALKVGIPAGIEKFVSFGSFLIFVKIVTGFGTYVLAGYQIGLRIEGLAFMPGFGFATAAMVLVGQYMGAKEPEKAEKSVIQTVKLAGLFMGIVGVFFIVFPEFFVSLFTDNIKTIREGSLYLRIVGVSQIPLAVDFVLNGALKGAGATKVTLIINSLSFWIFRIIPAYISAKIFNDILIVYIVMTIETFIKGFILWTVFKSGFWKKIKI